MNSEDSGEVARYIARAASGRVSKAALIGAVPPIMLRTEANPGGLPHEMCASHPEIIKPDLLAFVRS